MQIKINEVTKVRFEVGVRGAIPAGRVCRIVEEDGGLTVHIRPGNASSRATSQLNQMHDQILGSEGRWAQAWDGGEPDRADRPAKGRGLAVVTWRIVTAHQLPRGMDCFPLEGEARFEWLFRPRAVTPQLCTEMTQYLARITGDGLWVQRWDGSGPRVN
ncbi:hypothetical protein [Streptomyces liangshanensis]|uniref:hypothetical protein n=1 Tax=Streptomyces liangshanensis TaxID=2717324 RepID=UPI0036DB6649